MRRGQALVGVLAAVLATGAIGAGCGDDEETAAAATLSKEEWIAQADRICADGEREIDARADGLFGDEPPEAGQVERFAERVAVPGIARQVAGVRALGAPEGDEDEIEAIVGAAQRGVEELRSDPLAIESSPGPMGEATRLLAAYGSTVCGSAD